MIHISRDRADETGKPIRPNDDWFRKAAKAQEIAKREGKDHSVKKHVYGHQEVRLALEALFHGKCAYCESMLGLVDHWDVDHFRPKGRVAERPDHPGYYWLVYEWANLYPACKLCNQWSHDPPRWSDPSVGAGGKWDSFPLEDEACRAMAMGEDLALENPLLLDPCEDEPRFSLAFDVEGYALGLDRRGEISIKAFHLGRKRLRIQRQVAIKEAMKVVSRIRKLAPSDPFRQEFEAELEKLTRDEHPYAAAARAVRDDPAAFGID